MIDINILSNYLDKNQKILTWKVLKNETLTNELNSYYNDSSSLKETIWRIIHHQHIRPVCKVCGKPVKFDGNISHLSNTNNGFFWHCSNRCAQSDDDIIKKSKCTRLNRYGNANYNNISKIKETYIKHYDGIGFASEYVNAKIKSNCQLKYKDKNYNNPDLAKLTKLKLYGNENFNNNEKYVSTMIHKYGVVNYWCTEESRLKRKTQESLLKEWNTKCKNGTLKTSKYEKIIYSYIRNNYNFNIIKNDRKILNGKEIDLYFPQLNLGIEIQGDFYHANPIYFTAIDTINLPSKPNTLATTIWEKDYKKQLLAISKNIKMIYIWEYDIKNNFDNVKKQLDELFQQFINIRAT